MIAAELYQARRTRSMWWLAVVATVFAAGWAAVDGYVWRGDGYSMAAQGYVFAMTAGVLLVAGDYRHRTITWAVLVCPDRTRVLVAKLAACAVVGVAIGLSSAVLTTAVLVMTAPPAWAALLGSVAGTALWTVFGGALGALVRNQFAAVLAAFAWFYYAEWFLVMLVPAVGRWTPTGAAKAVSGWTRDALPVAGDLLPVWAGGVVFLGYTVVAAGLAALTTGRRDVT